MIERTIVILKPDAVQRSLVGEIIQRFERVGLKIVATKMVVANEEIVGKHYSSDPDWRRKAGEKSIEGLKLKGEDVSELDPKKLGELILSGLKRYMTAGPIVVMALEGSNSVKLVRKIVGGTEPLSSDVGTIRGDYVLDSYSLADGDGRSIRNLIHASGTSEEAKLEMKLWFGDSEVMEYQTAHEHILYDVNFDNIPE